MISQYDESGRLRHLITLDGCSGEQITELLDRAEEFLRRPGDLPARTQALAGRTVANLFFEPSTRTRASFELAARRLGADVLSLDISTSSRAKGESLLDTIYTLQAMQCDIFVVRDAQAGVPAFIAEHVAPHVRILNAGESYLNHPTQGLLDMLTIRRHKKAFDQLVVTIVGDIHHSRVARSAAHALGALGVGELRLVAPEHLRPEPRDFPGALISGDLDQALSAADVVMALRIQKERMTESAIPDPGDYFRRFGLDTQRLALAKPDVIVMHPGPMNRNVEISPEVADGKFSVIEEQVTNGVAVRMAVMQAVMAS
ncbi:MAG: aspartate carbamoyltransferase catalytic subunit [Gammaproteobacteria bacterium]